MHQINLYSNNSRIMYCPIRIYYHIKVSRKVLYAVVFMLLFFMALTSAAQELRVKSFAPVPTDLTARKQPRQDLNGRQCALLKVMVMDDIIDCGNANIGSIGANGVTKFVYVPSVVKSLTLNFKYHYPLSVVFADYGVQKLDGGATYEMRLVDEMKMMVQSGNGGDVAPVPHKENAISKVKPESTGNVAPNWRQLFVEAEKSKDYKKAFNICKKSAEAGNAEAQRHLAYCYKNGKGCKADSRKALDWYKKAVDNGDGTAAFLLGCSFQDGDGIIVKDEATAFKYFKISADLGDRDGMSSLAYCYEKGSGTKPDIDKALDLRKQLAENETDGYQSYFIGAYYAWGQDMYYFRVNGTAPDNSMSDYTEALKWFRRSADMNNQYAMNAIGECYMKGWGVSKDKGEAVKWYRKAADLGNTDAMGALGYAYEKGQGVERSLDDAKYWYAKGAEKGDTYCKEAMERLETGWVTYKDCMLTLRKYGAYKNNEELNSYYGSGKEYMILKGDYLYWNGREDGDTKYKVKVSKNIIYLTPVDNAVPSVKWIKIERKGTDTIFTYDNLGTYRYLKIGEQ